MKAVTQGGYSCRVGEDVEECGAIPGIARARVGSHHEAQESHFGRGRERQKHEFWPTIVIILLVSLQDYIVERCQQSGTSYVKFGFPTVPSRQQGCHRGTGVSRQQVIRFVFESSNLTKVTTVTMADEIGFYSEHFRNFQ